MVRDEAALNHDLDTADQPPQLQHKSILSKKPNRLDLQSAGPPRKVGFSDQVDSQQFNDFMCMLTEKSKPVTIK